MLEWLRIAIGIVWKEAAVAYFKYCLKIFHDGLKEIQVRIACLPVENQTLESFN
jgi:hypothetical protein